MSTVNSPCKRAGETGLAKARVGGEGMREGGGGGGKLVVWLNVCRKTACSCGTNCRLFYCGGCFPVHQKVASVYVYLPVRGCVEVGCVLSGE